MEIKSAGDSGTAEVLGKFKLLCPGEPLSDEELEEMCKDERFKVSTKKNTRKRVLGFHEVKAINEEYMIIRGDFLEKRLVDHAEGEGVSHAIGEAELNLSAWAVCHHAEGESTRQQILAKCDQHGRKGN